MIVKYGVTIDDAQYFGLLFVRWFMIMTCSRRLFGREQSTTAPLEVLMTRWQNFNS
jgi:hypothetical protein